MTRRPGAPSARAGLNRLAAYTPVSLLLLAAAMSAQAQDVNDALVRVSPSLNYTSELFGATGGHGGTGGKVFGLGAAALEVDLPSPDGVDSRSVQISALWLHGDPISDALGDLNGVSNIAGVSTLRLHHAWFEQTASGRALRLGKFDVDEHYMVSDTGSLFTNSGFGTMATATLNMPLPTYPLAAMGALLDLEFEAGSGVSLAIFDGDVGTEDDERDGVGLGSSGVGGVLLAVESRWDHVLSPGGGTFKIGGMLHSGEFERLAKPGDERWNGLVYAVLDQTLWRRNHRSLTGFLRASTAPFDDRNLVTYQLDAGFVIHDPLSRGAVDALGVAVVNTWLSDAARRDPQFADRGSETVLEITLLAQVFSNFTVQPTVQYVWGNSLATGDHALVAGLRLSMDL